MRRKITIGRIIRIINAILNDTVVRLYKVLGRWYITPMLLADWKWSRYKQINERAVEFAFAFKWLSKICPAEVLDVGSGTTAWPHIMANCGFGVTAIDKIRGYWKGGFFNRHYYIIHDDITKPKIAKQFDFLTCLSVLEHIPDHKAAFKGMFELLNPSGYILLTFPYNETRYVENVYKLPEAGGYGKGAPYICQVFSRNEIDNWLQENRGIIIKQEYYEIFTGDLWAFGKRICPPRRVKKQERCHLTCLVIQKTC